MYTNSDLIKNEKMAFFLGLIKARGHKFVSGNYQVKTSTLTISCPLHGVINTNFDNYRRSKTGCRGCGSEKTSVALIGREYSHKTIQLMKEAARNRPLKPRDDFEWRSTQEYRDWRINVRKSWNHQCAITGLKGVLDCHHIVTGSVWKEGKFMPKNGILLCRSAHWTFHKQFGSKRNNLSQLVTFIDMLISSQAQLENWDGSETRSYDPERIMRTQERLAQLKTELVVI